MYTIIPQNIIITSISCYIYINNKLHLLESSTSTKTSFLICESVGVVKRTPKSLKPTHNYPKMAVAGNLPQNINILETFVQYGFLLRLDVLLSAMIIIFC